MGIIIDITGRRFARLTVVAMAEERVHGRIAWHCRCDCGRELIVSGNALQANNTRSCGCYKLDTTGARRRTHGKSRTPEYKNWCAMKARCYDTNNQDYGHYGGRGIRVCERWKDSFENFLADMGTRPHPRSTIERKDPNKDYSPANCQWASQKQQTRNKRTSRMLTVDGQTKCIGEWAEQYGVRQHLIAQRIRQGWPEDAAVKTAPLKRWNRMRHDNYKQGIKV